MKMKQSLAVMLCVAMISSGTGMMSLADVNHTGGQELGTVQRQTESGTGQGSNYFRSRGKVTTPSNTNNSDEDINDEILNDDDLLEEEIELEGGRKTRNMRAGDQRATPSEAVYVSTEEELREAVTQSRKIVLEQEIPLTKQLEIPRNVDIVLEGEGITFAGDNKNDITIARHMIWISKSAKVTLSNIMIDATGLDCTEKYEDNGRDYYAIFGDTGTEIVLSEGAEIIANDSALSNPNKRGLWISGTGLMEEGIVSGFASCGIVVAGEFTMEGGELTENGAGLAVGGKASDKEEGRAYLKGGFVTGNETGVLNNGYFEMTGGEITENGTGLTNNNLDSLANQKFYPRAILNKGRIADNTLMAIWNKHRGTVVTGKDIEISSESITGAQFRSRAVRASQETKTVIWNEDESNLNIEGGTITSYAPNEIAVLNDSTSRLKMTVGEIIAAGEKSIAIKNANAKAGDVVIDGGMLTATGTGSYLLDNQGAIDINEIEFGGEDSGKHYIVASQVGSGKVTPSFSFVTIGDTVTFAITPDAGYRILNVTVDGVSIGGKSSCTVNVTGNHQVTAEFVKRQSSGGGGGGGSSSGSPKTAAAAGSMIPETPGAWAQDQTGWKFVNGEAPYINTWVRKNSQWYWVGEDGYMKTGWNLILGKWYYMTAGTGEMKTGWIADQGGWYYADGTGARVTGWVQTGEKWYYLNADGKMAAGTVTPDGYQVDASGAWIQ